MEKKETVKTGDGFIDRSKVRILLCDNDSESSREVITLLCKCSYQVTSVRSPRQVVDALNAEGPDIDIILCEVDIPMPKGMKLLKYIMRDNELRRIPVIMMSSQDDVSVVVKCLRLGAADYLVKPLRTNELLNLWTHMWRRRRMLGLVEKNVINYDFGLVVSDPSDANTNSTTLFSDDTNEKSRKRINPETGPSSEQDDEANATTAASREAVVAGTFECQPDVIGSSDQNTGKMCLFPKKSELKIGESSAFLTYVKSSRNKCAIPEDTSRHEILNVASGWNNAKETIEQAVVVDGCEDYPRSSNNMEIEDFHKAPVSMHQTNETHNDMSGFHAHAAYPPPYYIPGMVNHHVMMPAGMGSYTYYPMNMCMQPWPSSSDGGRAKMANIIDRREVALMKFREKRKARCFDKKIRYVNRKRLADGRPRVRGQFVRKPNGVLLDLNGHPPPSPDVDVDEDVDDDEDDDPDTIADQTTTREFSGE